MFDLENSIKLWLKNFGKFQAFDTGILQEMELHLRDHIEDLKAKGVEEEEAFKLAVAEFGDIPEVAKEEYWNHARQRSVLRVARVALLKNYYFVAIRNLLRHSSYFTINIAGLAVGIASFAFIALYVINETNYDLFHSKYEQIYRVSSESKTKGHSAAKDRAVTNAPLAKTMVELYPEVINACRITKSRPLLIGRGDLKIMEDEVYYADSAFFSLFDFELIKGDRETALDYPKSILLSESYAKKYFGHSDPIGESLTIDEDTTFYTVRGVFADFPANSHLQFDLLASMISIPRLNNSKWIGTNVHTYALLDNRADPDALEEKMHEIVSDYIGKEIEFYTGTSYEEWVAQGNHAGHYLRPLKDIHLRSTSSEEFEPTGKVSYMYIYGLIGMVILMIAIFNFVNLATTHSASRAKEVGVRKVIGSSKGNLISQFLLDSMLVALVAGVFALLLVYILTPFFYELIGKELAYGLNTHVMIWVGMIVVALIVGLLAGIYPAFVLSAFKPINVLKGQVSLGAKSGWLRNFLVTLQFSASIIIVIGTLVIYNQIDFMLSQNLGFDREQVLVIERPDGLGKNLETFKEELRRNPNVKAVANAISIPGKEYIIRAYRKDDDPHDETFVFKNNQVSHDHLELMGLDLVAGRFFSKKFASDSDAVVINESAAKAFGYEDPIGKTLNSVWKKGRPLPIIGIIKDYNIKSLHEDVEPITLELDPSNTNGYLNIKLITTQDVRQTLASIEETWYEHSQGMPFQYFFFDEEYQNLYKSEVTAGRILIVFSGLSIFIACLGLIGLVAFTATIRRKEIGIRKVLGASATTLIRLLSSEIARLILIATLISWPLAYFAIDYWLQNFSARISVSAWIYLGSTLVLILIVGGAISFQTIRAAFGNPVECLREE